jgi:hypothetical protein
MLYSFIHNDLLIKVQFYFAERSFFEDEWKDMRMKCGLKPQFLLKISNMSPADRNLGCCFVGHF